MDRNTACQEQSSRKCALFFATKNRLAYPVKQSDLNARSNCKSTGRCATARNAHVFFIPPACRGGDSRDQVGRKAGRLRAFETWLSRDRIGFRSGDRRTS